MSDDDLAEAFGRALAAGDDALLRACLARRGDAPRDLAARIADAFVSRAASSPAMLARAASALQAHHPTGLSDPRVTATLHLGLEADALSPRDAWLALQPILASEARAWALFGHAPHAPLLDRLRAANVCRGVALATTLIGGLDPVLGEDGVPRFLEVLAALARDPDPAVGARAAWAAGAASRDERATEALAGVASRAGAGLSARRALVADVARWQLGELDDDALVAALGTGIGRSDPFARAAAIAAMRLGARVAPDTTLALVASFADDKAPAVRAAVATYALGVDDDDARAELLRRAGVAADADPALAAAVHPATRPLAAALRRVRAAALGGRDALGPAVDAALDALGGASSALDARAREALVDLALHDTPLLFDADAASGGGASPLLARVAREAFERRASPDAPLHADGARALRRALDALPAGELDGLPAITARLFVPLASGDDGRLARPVASAWAAAVERLARGERTLPSDVVGALLSVGSSRALGHAAAALGGPAAAAARALADLSALLEVSLPRGNKPLRADALAAAARTLAERASALGPGDGPLARGASALADALDAIAEPGASPESRAFEGLRDAILALRDARDVGAARLGAAPAPSPRATTDSEIAHALRSALAPHGLASADPARASLGADKAKKRVAAALPPALAGVVDAALAAERPPAKAAPSGPVYPGKRFGDYVVERVLGSGAMGHCVVVKRRLEAKDPNARRWVLKVPQRPDLADAFRDEALALIDLSRQRHPAIVRFVSFVDYGTRLPFLVMEHVEGVSLEQRLAAGALAPDLACRLGAELASGLALAHDRGLCHHDVKTANVVVARRGATESAVLVDWGLAGAGVPDAGTPEYMAPERFEPAAGPRRLEPILGAADVFALGCILAEMGAGAPLVTPTFTAEDSAEDPVLASTFAHVAEPYRRWFGCSAVVRNASFLRRRAERALSGLPASARDVAFACLAGAPADRPKAGEVARALAGAG